MIQLLPIEKIIRAIALLYALLFAGSLIVAQLASGAHASFLETLRWAIAGSAFLEALVLLMFSVGWRWLWRKFPKLGDLVFPDLGGRWVMTITWNKPDTKEGGTLEAVATVRQDFRSMGMMVSAPSSDSRTLSISPRRDHETGQLHLHYIFEVTKHPTPEKPSATYQGAAILRVVAEAPLRLEGNYWTSEHTSGRYTLARGSGTAIR